jgi:hypothetical protein
MYDFPIPEDPPVMITAEKVLSAASGVGMGLDFLLHHRRTSARPRSA